MQDPGSKFDLPRGADNVSGPGTLEAIVLQKIIEIDRKVFVQFLIYTSAEPVSVKAAGGRIKERFIRYKCLKAFNKSFGHRLFDRDRWPITPGVYPGPYAVLKLAAVRNAYFFERKAVNAA